MRQYYRIALVNHEWKVKVIKPSGYKLMEHAYYWSEAMKRVQNILYRDALNVMWVGDYSKINSLVWKHEFEDMEDSYDKPYTESDLLDIEAPDYIEKDYHFYLINKSQYEFIDMTKQVRDSNLQDSYGWVVHPLPLLTLCETEEASGDYHSETGREHIGEWCGDIISIYRGSWAGEVAVELEAQGYKDMTDIYMFKE